MANTPSTPDAAGRALTTAACPTIVQLVSSFRCDRVEEFGTNSVAVACVDGARVLKLRGELDIAMVPAVRTRLDELDGDVQLDCGDLTFMDAAGVNLFVEIHQICRRRGVKLSVVNAPRCVRRLLVLAQVDTMFDVRTEDERR
jgi:anti-anti-sigma factor